MYGICTVLAGEPLTDTFGGTMRYFLGLGLAFLLSGPGMAQDTTLQPPAQPAPDTQPPEGGTLDGLHSLPPPHAHRFRPGRVEVVESERIKAIMAGYTERKQVLQGYRVQIFLGTRDQAEDVRRHFLQQHPDIPTYLSYLAPNFRVRIGDLRDRLDAELLREKFKSAYPGLYIVPDEIKPPALLPEADPEEPLPGAASGDR